MPIVSFQTTFNLTLSPIQAVFTDTTNWASYGIGTADVNACLTIVSPSGITIYNNTNFSDPGCDIHILVSTVSQQLIVLPLNSFGFPEAGNYTITCRVFDSNLNVYYTQTNVVNFQYASPEVCINQRIDCISPLFSSVDLTNYTVNGVVPVVSGTHTLDYPYGSAGEGTPTVIPFTATGSVIAVSIFYQGTQTTEISSNLTYTFVSGVNAFIIIDSISGRREIKVDCAYICSILCCVKTFERLKESYNGVNDVLYAKYDNIFQEIMAYIQLMQFSINCGLGSEVCDYLNRIKTLSNCTDACSCGTETPSRVIGLGYLVGPAGPAGPQGPQGASGYNGNYITVTAEPIGVNCANGGQLVTLYDGFTNAVISLNYICNGANGSDGAAGTNAFKFVKQFTTEDIEQSLVITYAERTQCTTPPNGCIDDGGDPNLFIDMHIQVWLYVALPFGNSYWNLLVQKGNAPVAGDYDIAVGALTGNITITTANNSGIYRVVILQ